MTDADLHWLVGYLEGEGCFTSRIKPGISGGQPIVCVLATDRDVVERAAKLMGACSVRESQPRHPWEKVRYDTRLDGNRAIELMKVILPLMGIRRSKRIREVLELAAQRPGYRRGEVHPKATHSEATIKEVKRRLRNGERGRYIARDLHLTEGLVSSVKKGHTWRHINAD